MQHVNLGGTGLMVSRLAFGAMTLGQGTLVGDLVNNIDQAAADKLVGMCLDKGINFFDTADMYTSGQSEIMLGRALGAKRDDVIITTKCGFRSGDTVTASGLSYRYILSAVQASLKRLQTDYIDLYLLHIPDPHTPVEETARALDDIVRRGYVRYVGYCNYPSWQAQKLLDHQKSAGLAPLITAQMYYSLLGRDLEHEYIDFLQANNLGLMVWSPLASGFLTGKYTRETPVPAGSRRAKFDFPPIDVETGYAVVAALQQIAGKHNATVAQIALAWLLAKPVVSSIIVGATQPAQLEDNLGAAQINLTTEDIAALEEVSTFAQPYPAWMQAMGHDAVVTAALAG